MIIPSHIAIVVADEHRAELLRQADHYRRVRHALRARRTVRRRKVDVVAGTPSA